MSQPEKFTQSAVDVIVAALLSALGEDGFDVLPDEQGTTVAADDWSLRIETSPAAIAWLAVDDEPDDAAEYRSAIGEALTSQGVLALAEANGELGGALSRMLRASGDQFSATLATRLEHLEKEIAHG